MTRREFPKRIKALIVHRAMNKDGQIVCEGCGLILGAKLYEIDHVVAEALITDKSAPLTAADGQLLGMACCHRSAGGKTAQDVTRIAKAVRAALDTRANLKTRIELLRTNASTERAAMAMR